jgi:hypothetical protein
MYHFLTVKVFRPEWTNLDLRNSYFRAAKRLLRSTFGLFYETFLVLSGPPSLSPKVLPIMFDFNLGAEVGTISALPSSIVVSLSIRSSSSGSESMTSTYALAINATGQVL